VKEKTTYEYDPCPWCQDWREPSTSRDCSHCNGTGESEHVRSKTVWPDAAVELTSVRESEIVALARECFVLWNTTSNSPAGICLESAREFYDEVDARAKAKATCKS